MRRHLDKLVLLVLLALLVAAVHAHTRFGAATAKPVNSVGRGVPALTDRGATKFDLLFREAGLALP